MRIAKPLLMVTTPLGVVWGLLEAHRLAGGLVFLMAAFVLFMSAAIGMVVHTIRREKREEIERTQWQAPSRPVDRPEVHVTPPTPGNAPRPSPSQADGDQGLRS